LLDYLDLRIRKAAFFGELPMAGFWKPRWHIPPLGYGGD
jgi:hypothetical protein